jgi:glycerate kinase
MRALIAPSAFKGSLRPREASRAIAEGLQSSYPEIELIERPLADGGDGTLEVLLHAFEGSLQSARVEDPLGRPIEAEFGLLDDGRIAVIEMARAAGVALFKPEELDPLRASTYGVGRLVLAALDQGAREIWLGLGGSATVDGGAGFLEALGARLPDGRGRPIPRGGAGLAQLAAVDLATVDVRVKNTALIALSDVLSPLLGLGGARLYMPQKGATPAMCEELERNLAHFAEIALRDTGIDVREVPGAGAAGGLGAALALLGAQLVSGSEFIIEKLELEERIGECDLVIGGEGQVDVQTLEGKGTLALARLANRSHTPLVVLCGSRSGDLRALHEAGVTAVFSIVPGPIPLEDAVRTGFENMRETARQLGALLRALA